MILMILMRSLQGDMEIDSEERKKAAYLGT
jgi:hypothetical protein